SLSLHSSSLVVDVTILSPLSSHSSFIFTVVAVFPTLFPLSLSPSHHLSLLLSRRPVASQPETTWTLRKRLLWTPSGLIMMKL
ncbi:hypothetical protein PFISCL1PPCAC_18314, partial [Pristionchus fissidentatus]